MIWEYMPMMGGFMMLGMGLIMLLFVAFLAFGLVAFINYVFAGNNA